MSKFGGHFSRENIFEVKSEDIFREGYTWSDTSAVIDLRKYTESIKTTKSIFL